MINAEPLLDEVLLDDLVDEVLCDPTLVGCCWGMELSGELCTTDFRPGTNHFKNKFCSACKRHGFTVPAERVRAASPSLVLSNANSRSAWTHGARLVNQTRKCVGPRVVIFRERVSTELAECQPVPDNWLRRGVSGALHVQFSIKLGTAVPMPVLALEVATKRARDEEEEMCPVGCLSGPDATSAMYDDVVALSAAVGDPHFQRHLKDRLGVCAATISSLGASERSCMHLMFREAMERQLAASVGDACLARVLRAFEGGGVLPGSATAHLQIPFLCAALCDEVCWADAVQQIAARRAASTPAAALIEEQRAPALLTHVPPGDLAALSESFALFGLRGRVGAKTAATQLQGKGGHAAVQRTVGLLQRQLEATHTPWEAMPMEVHPSSACVLRTHYSDGLLYCLTQVELDGADDAPDAAASGGLGARATEVLHRALEHCCTRCERTRRDQGGGSSMHDQLWRVNIIQDGVVGRMLQLLWGSYILELPREERPDGTRFFFVDWDAERDEPMIANGGQQLANVSMVSFRFDADKCTWQLSAIEAYVAPPTVVSTLSGSINGMVVDLCTTVCRYFLRASTALIVEYLNRALMESRAPLKLLVDPDADQGRGGGLHDRAMSQQTRFVL